MFPVMRDAKPYHGWIFCALLGFMFCYMAWTLVPFVRSQDKLGRWFLDGELQGQVENAFNQEYFLRNHAVRWLANVQFLLFGEGFAGVVLGKEGWLYSHDEFREPADLAQKIIQQVGLIQQVNARLSAHGKDLVVVLVPTKLELYPEFAQSKRPAHLDILYQRFAERLTENGIKVVDIRTPLLTAKATANVFLPNDTHWTPFGARIAAQAVAIQQPTLKGNQAFNTHSVGEQAVTGDLVHYLKFDPALAPAYFKPHNVGLFQTQPVDEGNPITEQALFGELELSLALVGTSYSKLGYPNFPGFLKAALHQDLWVTAVAGKGAYYAMEEFINGLYLENAEINTVIWEFPIRLLLNLHNP